MIKNKKVSKAINDRKLNLYRWLVVSLISAPLGFTVFLTGCFPSFKASEINVAKLHSIELDNQTSQDNEANNRGGATGGNPIDSPVIIPLPPAQPAKMATIAIDSTITHQIMDPIGPWETVATGGQPQGLQGGLVSFPKYQNELMNLAVSELGLNRIRLEITAVSENPTRDWWQDYQDGLIDYSKWKLIRGDAVNDNNDPFVINWSAFHFGNLDTQVESIIQPMKNLLANKGEEIHVNLCFVDFRVGPLDYGNNPEEYAETILATFLHLKNKYNLVPNSLEVALEPDNSDGWRSGTLVGRNLVAAAKRLANNGFYPQFIGPSTLSTHLASTYFDDMIKVPGVLKYLDVISYHRYAGVSDSNIKNIANRAKKYGIASAMLEQIGYGYEALHKDLKVGNVSAWTQWSLAAVAGNSLHQYVIVDQSNPNLPVLNMPKRTQFYSQYFKYIRAGALRIEAVSKDSNFNPVGFINSNGKYVIVVTAKQAGNFTVGYLPTGSYGIRYTTPSEYAVSLPDVVIGTGDLLNSSIPRDGVITIYKK